MSKATPPFFSPLPRILHTHIEATETTEGILVIIMGNEVRNQVQILPTPCYKLIVGQIRFFSFDRQPVLEKKKLGLQTSYTPLIKLTLSHPACVIFS